MEYRELHPWQVSPGEARRIQDKLRDRVVISPLPSGIRHVAGADVSFDKGSNLVHAAVVLIRLPDLVVVEKRGVSERTSFPYVPGLLAFREGPPVLRAWEQLTTRPDVVMFDAHGMAHPRRFGLACHLGLILSVPSVGCAKSVLVGSYRDPGPRAGDMSPLVDGGEEVGMALRTRDRVSPVFVTVGHKSDLPTAVELVLACTHGYRVPEPTRQAHLVVNALRRGESIDSAGDSVQETLF
ncbi:MAG: deoxyribonuclease V [Fidelibacterota bacterium]